MSMRRLAKDQPDDFKLSASALKQIKVVAEKISKRPCP